MKKWRKNRFFFSFVFLLLDFLPLIHFPLFYFLISSHRFTREEIEKKNFFFCFSRSSFQLYIRWRALNFNKMKWTKTILNKMREKRFCCWIHSVRHCSYSLFCNVRFSLTLRLFHFIFITAKRRNNERRWCQVVTHV